MSEQQAQRVLLVIAGSGRSGTSLMSGLCGRLGYAIPQPEVVANDTNPRGFGEPRWAVDFHKRLMQSWSISHDDGRPDAWTHVEEASDRQRACDELAGWLQEQFDLSDRVVVKDPRLAWFLDVYADVARDLGAEFGVVMMLRHPAATIRSKQLAYGNRIDATTRASGWLNLMLGTELRSRERRRALVRYDDLLADWRSTLERAEQQLGLDVVSQADPGQLAAAGDLVDPSLRRTEWTWDELDLPGFVREVVESTHGALSDLAEEYAKTPDPSTEGVDLARQCYETTYREAEALVRSSVTAAKNAQRKKLRAQAGKRPNQQQGSANRAGKTQSAAADRTGQRHGGGGLPPSLSRLGRRVGRLLGRGR